MEVVESDGSKSLKLSINIFDANILSNLVLNTLEFGQGFDFFSKTTFSKAEVESFLEKIGDIHLLFPDEGGFLNENSHDVSVALWFGGYEISLLMECAHFCDNHIDDWEYETLIGEEKEVVQTLYDQLKKAVDES